MMMMMIERNPIICTPATSSSGYKVEGLKSGIEDRQPEARRVRPKREKRASNWTRGFWCADVG